MYFTPVVAIIFALLTQAAFGQDRGYHIPENQTDGVYAVKVFDNGTEHHVRIGNIRTAQRTTYNVSDSNLNHPHSSYNIRCYPEEGLQDLDHRTTDAANAALDAQCGDGSGVWSGYNFYSISECVVAYFCHFNAPLMPTSAYCSAEERGQASRLISAKCGLYKPGSGYLAYYPNAEAAQHTVAYGYESYCTPSGHIFCGHGV